jgi:hypothetical protein
MTWALAAALIVLLPAVAAACATCVSSAFGDRSYNWAYLGLVLMPFALTAVVGVLIAVRMGWRPRVRQRLTTVKAWLDRSRLSHVKAWLPAISLSSDRSTRPSHVKAWLGAISLFSDRSTRPAAGPHLASPLPRKKHGETT